VNVAIEIVLVDLATAPCLSRGEIRRQQGGFQFVGVMATSQGATVITIRLDVGRFTSPSVQQASDLGGHATPRR
jgi:hypothetical protein